MKGRRAEQKLAARLWRACQVGGVADGERLRAAIELILEQQPIGWQGLARELLRRWRLDLAQRTADVECAAPLSAATQTAMAGWLRGRFPALTDVRFRDNPELIGGVRIQVGSDVIDDSIQGRLVELKNRFGGMQ
ncbi:MAG: hypothetical protein A3K19_29920 [Lentisphaerae bacterium RIFOXYB12_FULL_65_16]|nr:MAG: hypothetical protein A3K18_33530 [Lentisphaerae bacterium RIFOXYA12_64_32]OGV86545.1 MAG: hypothetical protein A3K19_29920 [Lentisphaerae bacterium RIFOXYB12_FULL_65_16]